ncbi:MAG TPA: 16S rRNA methyltransferase [Thermoplasmata archaeon]|nr:16S rRNA methyltransferase [Thermoplasmata archaeon]
MISFILAESELELVPKELLSHKVIVSSVEKRGKKPGEILLDSNFHHNALTKVEDGERRGRPDITHIFLLITLESVANKRGLIKNLVIHTRNNDVIYVDPKTRIMRSYNRFVGLIEQLFTKPEVADDKNQLLKLKRNFSLKKLIKKQYADKVIACTSTGEKVDLYKYLSEIEKVCEKKILFIIGGFPKGDFKTDVKKLADDVISIYHEPLTAWSVASEITTIYNLLCK